MKLTQLQAILIRWYKRHKRDLPWRNFTDPYTIWISEIILQQTRVNQGLPYFYKFQKNYPTVRHLAEADEAQVLKDWEGLGYYSRARNLHATAKYIHHERQGDFPGNYKDLLKLKGVGAYTAAAISSFSYNEAQAVVDGNVYRVLARLFGISTPINTSKGIKEFRQLAQEQLAKKEAATYNQAIMEFGAIQCVPTNPNCEACPLAAMCYAYTHSCVNDFPVKQKKKYNRLRYFNYAMLTDGDKIFVQQRQASDIWKKLHQFFLIEAEDLLTSAEVMEQLSAFLKTDTALTIKKEDVLKPHKLSHQTIYCKLFIIEIKKASDLSTQLDGKWLKTNAINSLAFPKPLREYLDRFQLTLPDHN